MPSIGNDLETICLPYSALVFIVSNDCRKDIKFKGNNNKSIAIFLLRPLLPSSILLRFLLRNISKLKKYSLNIARDNILFCQKMSFF